MAKVDPTTLNGVTAHAANILLQTLGALLVNKGLITRDEWKNCMKEGATFLQSSAEISPTKSKPPRC